MPSPTKLCATAQRTQLAGWSSTDAHDHSTPRAQSPRLLRLVCVVTPTWQASQPDAHVKEVCNQQRCPRILRKQHTNIDISPTQCRSHIACVHTATVAAARVTHPWLHVQARCSKSSCCLPQHLLYWRLQDCTSCRSDTTHGRVNWLRCCQTHCMMQCTMSQANAWFPHLITQQITCIIAAPLTQSGITINPKKIPSTCTPHPAPHTTLSNTQQSRAVHKHCDVCTNTQPITLTSTKTRMQLQTLC